VAGPRRILTDFPSPPAIERRECYSTAIVGAGPFQGANLSGAVLVGNFQNDSFTGANLSGVKYCNATIEGVLHNEAGGCPARLVQ
jgi:hypothetical protein